MFAAAGPVDERIQAGIYEQSVIVPHLLHSPTLLSPSPLQAQPRGHSCTPWRWSAAASHAVTCPRPCWRAA